MDDPNLDAAMHQQALAGLARIGRLSGTVVQFWKRLRAIHLREGGRRLQVLDLATGGGDVVIALARRAASERIPMGFTGCDNRQLCLERAGRESASIGVKPNWVCASLPDWRPWQPFDVVISNLFIHHLPTPAVADLLKAMPSYGRYGLICDLDRSYLGLAMAWLGCRVLSRSPVVHVDGPRSVHAALTAGEISALARNSGLTAARVTKIWPQRWMLSWTPMSPS
ncbi:MAG: methyltransferase domain-containing protein [Phycisphaeraceae bacterium]|nr:methyltransferase domain-containing protein [Phycisphaeraceae bacterium]